MHRQIRGVVHGRRIDLERETGLPDGADVTVNIEPTEPEAHDRIARIRALCGAWTDPSLDSIFAELESKRSEAAAREVNLDDSP